MSYNVNCITCQIVGKGEIKTGVNKKGENYKSQTIELKVPRQNPAENPKTGYDYIKMNAQTDVVEFLEKNIELFSWVNVDFVLRTFKTRDGKDYETRNAVLVTPAAGI